MEDNNQHFVDDKSYCGPGCISQHGSLEVVGNQPSVSSADTDLEEIGNEAIETDINE